MPMQWWEVRLRVSGENLASVSQKLADLGVEAMIAERVEGPDLEEIRHGILAPDEQN